jgi:imidazolonepropionase-like amidohydrolase
MPIKLRLLGAVVGALVGSASFCSAVIAQIDVAPSLLALVGGTVYVNPAADPVRDGVVLIENGKISRVGSTASTRIPRGTQVIDCSGLTIVPGFWNSHVHFTDSQWENAASLSAEQLSRQLEAMLTRWGITTVFDTGSLLSNTLALRRRIESSEISGPRILTAGEPFGAVNGTPYYIKPFQLPELVDVVQAAAAARARLTAGADAIKLHAGAIVDRDRDVWVAIPVDLVRAVADEAHRQGKFVLAHPQYLDGLRNAVDGGVDVLLHVTELLDAWPRDLLARAVERRVALVPTLKLLAPRDSRRRPNLLRQVRDYQQAGGEILFGTDVGFIPDYDPTEEFTSMTDAGMTFRQILRSLTTGPAERFGMSTETGRIAPGLMADIAVLKNDPATDVRALTAVQYTLQRGKIIYRAPR